MMVHMKLAGIDIGTNTLRLLIAEFSPDGRYRKIQSGRHITRLGEDLSHTGRLKAEAMERAMRVLEGFCDACDKYHVDGIYAVATSAVREAVNGVDFINMVKSRVGLEVNVIPGDEEARLTMFGVSSNLGIMYKNVFLMDIGGGSTEFILSTGGEIAFKTSTDIGVVRFTEQFLHSDPPMEEEIKSLGSAIEEHLRTVNPHFPPFPSLIGTAGTVTTLAAIEQRMIVYDPEKVHGYRIKKGGVEGILNMLMRMTNKERKDIPGIE